VSAGHPGVGRLARLLPAAAWLRGYTRADLNADLAAGLITAVLLVPQAMAYAMLAGLPPQVGLYAGVAAPIAYALFASSRVLAVGPVSVTAIMVASALAGVAGRGSPAANALVLALESGLLLFAMAALRLGGMVSFLSHPVLSGFTSAAAIVIVLTQVPPLLGIGGTASTASHEIVAAIAAHLGDFEPATLALGAASIVLLALAGRPLPRLLLRLRMPAARATALSRGAPLAVVLLALAAVAGLELDRAYGVATIGAIPRGLPAPDPGFLRLDTWLALLPSAALITVISYVESISIAKILAHRRRQRVDANQELVALGAANVAAAFTGGMPVAGGFSRTMVNFVAGARTQLAGIVTAVAMGAILLSFAHLFARLPQAALAAIVVVAVAQLIDLGEVRRLWRYQRRDAAVLLLTLGAVLVFGIELGLVVGVLASLLAHLWRTSRPHVALLGRIPGTQLFRNVRRHEVETWPHLALVRVDENLSFANIGRVEDFIMAHLARHPRVEHLVLVASAVNDIDSTALAALERLAASLRDAGVALHLAEVKGPVHDLLVRAGLPGRLAPGRIFFSTAEAVDALTGAARAAPAS